MIQTDRVARMTFASTRRRGGDGLLAPVIWLVGLVSTAVALCIGAVLAVLATAAVAFLALMGSIVLFFAGFAMRARRSRQMRRARASADEGVIDAEKVGDTWVAYGWERNSR